ncbi:MAG: dihydrofolate reductase [Candidatus Thermoplasmatota archaeon]|nr:dihydrofolate reductase [Candidatus Thermoplasmatota archaeon]
MQLKMILAMDLDGCIGKENGLPWRLRSDMLRFKRLTLGTGNSAVLMGRTTWETIPEMYRPLVDRINIVVTRNPEYTLSNAHVVYSIEDGIDFAKANKCDECWIIGGANVYEQCRDMVEEIHLTSVETSNSGDVKVGLFGDEWHREIVESTPQSNDNEHPTTYMILTKS